MKSIIYQLLTILSISFSFGCQNGNIDLNTTSILADRAYLIEKITCDETNRYFSWQCSFYQNYIQKDITTATEKNFTFKFDSDNFNREGYGFRVIVFVNNIIRFRRSTRDFPFDTPLLIPKGSTVSVQTYFEKYASANGDDSGRVNCKVSCE